MNKYVVMFNVTQWHYKTIEAQDEEQALEIARNLNPVDFEKDVDYNTSSDLEIIETIEEGE